MTEVGEARVPQLIGGAGHAFFRMFLRVHPTAHLGQIVAEPARHETPLVPPAGGEDNTPTLRLQPDPENSARKGRGQRYEVHSEWFNQVTGAENRSGRRSRPPIL